jgi:hypothetical protein
MRHETELVSFQGQTIGIPNSPLNLGNLIAYDGGYVQSCMLSYWITAAIPTPNRLAMGIGNVGIVVPLIDFLTSAPRDYIGWVTVDNPYPGGVRIINPTNTTVWVNSVNVANVHFRVTLGIWKQ